MQYADKMLKSINLLFQPFNKGFLADCPFTMKGVFEVPQSLNPGDYAIKIDLSNGKPLQFLIEL